MFANNKNMGHKTSESSNDANGKTYLKWKIETQQKDIDFLRRQNNKLTKKLQEALDKKRESGREK